MIEVFHDEEPVFGFMFTSYSVENREGELIRGLVTGNQIIYDKLSSYIKVCKTEDNQDVLIFDGAQRRRYVLRLRQPKEE